MNIKNVENDAAQYHKVSGILRQSTAPPPKKNSPEASGILQNLAPATQNHDMQKNSECLQNDAASCSNLLKTSSKFTKYYACHKKLQK